MHQNNFNQELCNEELHTEIVTKTAVCVCVCEYKTSLDDATTHEHP